MREKASHRRSSPEKETIFILNKFIFSFCNPLKYGAYETPKDARCMPTGLLDLSNCQNGSFKLI